MSIYFDTQGGGDLAIQTGRLRRSALLPQKVTGLGKLGSVRCEPAQLVDCALNKNN